MSNTFIDNGTEKPDILLGSVKKGIYAKEFSGGQVDPATGDFVFGISEGYMIENGKLGYPIKEQLLLEMDLKFWVKLRQLEMTLIMHQDFAARTGSQ